MIVVFEGDRAGEGQVGATIKASPGKLVIPGEAMHHDARWPTLRVKDVKDVVMRVAIMDDQTLPRGLGKGNVCREGVPLHRLTSPVTSAVVVQSGLPHYPDPRMPG